MTTHLVEFRRNRVLEVRKGKLRQRVRIQQGEQFLVYLRPYTDENLVERADLYFAADQLEASGVKYADFQFIDR